MQNAKKLISVLLLMTLLASCGTTVNNGDVTNAVDTTEPTVTADPSTVSDLPDKNWGGREFRVLGRKHDSYTQFNNFEVYSEGENGDVVNDAVYRRNSVIEDKYNVKITQTLVDAPQKELPKAILAGDDLYDLAFIEIEQIGKLALEHYFYDMNTVEYIDFSKAWWNPDVNESTSFFDKVYFTSSDFSLRDKNRAYIMIYNRDLCKKYSLVDPIEVARDGKWTIDVLKQYSKTVSYDVNGNGEVDIEDQFGICTDSYNGFNTLVTAAGNMGIRIDAATGEPVISLYNEHTISTVEKYMDVVTSPEQIIFCDDWNGKVDFDYWSTSTKVFKAGRGLVIASFPHSLKSYSADCIFDYGIVTMPKYDETQAKYLTMADRFCMFFAIPVSNPEPDFTGFMLEALSYASTDTTLHAYYEVSCKTKYTYDENSAEMLDLIFDGICYDPALIYSVGGLYNVIYNIAKTKTNDMASAYASIESTAKQAVANLIEVLSE